MKLVLKWATTTAVVVASIVSVGVLFIYFASQHEIEKQYYIPFEPYALQSNANAVANGKRLAVLTGCYQGCHGQTLEGSVMFDEPGVARIAAPNITTALRDYSNPELVRLLRHGLKRDGKSAWIMPSQMFSHLSEQDMNDLIAFIRSVPQLPGVDPEVNIQFLGRVGIVSGKLPSVASQIDHRAKPSAVVDRSNTLKYGEYLVKNTCVECHGVDLKGWEFIKAPDLRIARAYSDEAFVQLMRTGLGLGNRNLGLMTKISEVRFPHLSDDDIRAIRLYLNAFAAEAEAMAAIDATERNAG